jgi:uncharacterized membrane protein
MEHVKALRESLKLWEQIASGYTDTMCEALGGAVEQTYKMWQLPLQANHSVSPNGSHPPDPAQPPEIPKPSEETKTKESGEAEPVWTYRGYQLRSSDFTAAMVHFFRALIGRADFWRSRLDNTTNWAVITTAAALSLSWDPQIIILNTMLVTLFLFIEARRYRYYELYSYRARLLETDFFAAMLVPPFRPAPDWAESLAENLLHPTFSISMGEAFGRRFRRNYIWIYVILWVAWFLHIWLHPTTAASWAELTSRAAIGQFPAWLVLLIGVAFNGLLVTIGIVTMPLHHAAGDVLPGDGDFFKFPGATPPPSSDQRAWFRPSRQRPQLMALITTHQAERVGQRILAEMHRGVTSLCGTGICTGQSHPVLMCALTAAEVPRLKELVKSEDAQAFVVVLPMHEVLGSEFAPLL